MVLPLSYSTQELIYLELSSPPRPSTPEESEKTPTEPVYSPTNPLNNSENLALRITHPPVIMPPFQVHIHPDPVVDYLESIQMQQQQQNGAALTNGSSQLAPM